MRRGYSIVVGEIVNEHNNGNGHALAPLPVSGMLKAARRSNQVYDLIQKNRDSLPTALFNIYSSLSDAQESPVDLLEEDIRLLRSLEMYVLSKQLHGRP